MRPPIKVAQFGLGSIGLECLKAVAVQPWARIVGAVDCDPAKAGADLGTLTGMRSLKSLRVVSSIEQVEPEPDLVFHTAVSSFKTAYRQLQPLADRGIHVVSSCEQMIFPQLREAALARKLDQVCRASDARMVATGVNPGFVMDLLPVCLTLVTGQVREIHVERVVDASTRREALQRKIGSGLAPSKFRKLLRAGRAGHAGLAESLALIVHTLGHRPHRIVETSDAVVASHDLRTPYFDVRKGQTCGIHQRASTTIPNKLKVSLDLKMFLGARQPRDSIRVMGAPPIRLEIDGGLAGDEATVAALVSTAPRLLKAAPGLRLITELPWS